MRPRCRLVALVLLLVVFAAACGRAKAPPAQGPPPVGTGGFTWIAVADHFDEPAKGLVEGMVKAKPAFVVGIGDLVFESKVDDFRKFRRVILEPLGKIGARFYPVVGNHDFPVQPHWFGFWDPPANRLHYSFDYGNSHFVVLDTNKAMAPEDREFQPGTEEYAIQTQGESFEPGSEQYQWLRQDLATTKKTHIFVFFHVPAFSYGGHESSPAIQRALCPLFEKYRVTAVFMGHSHGYERFVPLRVDLSSGSPAGVPDEQNGVVYIVTAGGGMPLYDIERAKTHAALAKAFHFVRVDVDGDIARCTVIEAKDGRVLDSFELKSRRR